MYSVFDFDRRWSEVVPVLAHPQVQRALNAGMKNWLEQRIELRKKHGMSTVLSKQDLVWYTWNPKRGPWRYSVRDVWSQKATDKLNESPEWQAYQAKHCNDDDIEFTAKDIRVMDKIKSRFYPQPNTPDWFRCYGACHWLSGWNCAIGRLLMPDRKWYNVGTTRHRNAVGIGKDDAVFMDILLCNLESPTKIRQSVCRGRCRLLEDELAMWESPYASPAPEPLLRDLLAKKSRARRCHRQRQSCSA